MNAVAAADVPRGTADDFGGLVLPGETPEQALRRLEKTKTYAKTIGTDEGQRLLAAATDQVKDAPNGGLKAKASRNPARALMDAADHVTTHDLVCGWDGRSGSCIVVSALAEAQAAAHSAALEGASTAIVEIPLESIDVGDNVRINVAELDELASSIQVHGVLQPIKVRRSGDRFTIVWGQRRYLASKMVGLTTIPAIVVDEAPAADKLAIEQLVENLHRADLPPLDRARAMRAVVDAGMSQADLARELGIAPSTVSNDLGLLDAPKPIQSLVESGDLSPAHAKALKGLAPKTQVDLARRAAERGTSAHAVEEEVQRQRQWAEREAKERAAQADRAKADVAKLEASIAELAAKPKPGLATEIVVYQDHGDTGKAGHLADGFRKAGFTNVRIEKDYNRFPQARPKGCDCTAWKATLRTTYSYDVRDYVTKLSATPACIVAKHREVKAAADRKAEAAKYELMHRVQAHVETTARVVSAGPGAFAMDRLLAESVLWDALSYRLPDWAEKRGGKRNKPWTTLHALSDEELAAELTKALAGDFRDKAGYHIDWLALADELGIPAEAPAKKTAAAVEEE